MTSVLKKAVPAAAKAALPNLGAAAATAAGKAAAPAAAAASPAAPASSGASLGSEPIGGRYRVWNFNLPPQKGVAFAFATLFGIGRTQGFRLCGDLGLNPYQKLREIPDADFEAIKHKIETTFEPKHALLKRVGGYHGDPLYAPSADGYAAGSAARVSPDDASPPPATQPIHSPKGNTSAERWGQASPLHMAASLRMDGSEHAPAPSAAALAKLPSLVNDWSAMSRTGSFPGSSSAKALNVHERQQAAQMQKSPITGGTQRDNAHPAAHSAAAQQQQQHPSQREGVRATEAAMTAPSSPAPSLMPQPSSGSRPYYRADSPDSDSDILAADMNNHHASESSSGGRGAPTIRTNTAGDRIPAPLPSPGFGGATAASFFRSHLRAIAFTARLSNMTQHAGGSESPTGGREGGHTSYEHGGEMSEEQFQKLAESLSRDESVQTMKSMFDSLQQFRTLLVESRTLAGSELQKEETFNRIVTRVRSVVQAEAVVLLMVDKTAELLYASAATTPQGHVSYQTSLTHSFGGHVLRYKSSLNLKFSAEKDPRYDPDLSRKLGVKFRSVLAVPVFNKHGSITSVILCVNKRTSHHKEKQQFFGEQDQQLVEFIAMQAGGLIENALLFDEAVTRRNQTETLLQLTELMASELDTTKVLHRMLEASYLLVNAEKITLFMIDQEKEELVAVTRGERSHMQGASGGAGSSASVAGGSNAAPKAPQRFSINRGILGYCATSGKPVNVLDARKDWRFDPEVDSAPDLVTRSLLTVAVTDHMSKPIAVIQAVNKKAMAAPQVNPITGGSAAGIKSQSGLSTASGSLASPAVHNHRRSISISGGSDNGAGSLYSNSTLHYFTRDEEALLQSMAVSAGILLRKSKLYEEAISTRKKTEALLQISELMSADLQSDKIMAKIVQAAYMLVNCESILLYMVDETAGELLCEVGKDGSKGSRIPLGHGVAGHTALTGRSLNIADAQNDWRFDPSEHSSAIKNRVQTILAIPVKDYLGKNVGVIEIINKRHPQSQVPVPFSPEDEEVLTSLAYTAGAVLRKSKLFDEAISRRRQTEALLQINEIMSAEIGSEAIMKRIVEAAYNLVDCDRITLFAVDPKTGELVCQVSKDPFFQGVRMGYGHGIVGHVALTRRSLNIVDAYSDPRFNQLSDLKTGYKTHSILTVPVTDRKGQSVAVIQAVNKKGDKSFNSEDVLMLESMAVNAGMLLQKSRLFDAAVVADRKSRALVRLVMTASREDQSTEWIMHEVGNVALDALSADRVYIFFVDQIKEELTCVVGPDEEGWTVALGRGIAGYVALTGELVNVQDAYKHGKFDRTVDVRADGYKPKTILCMGVKNNDGEVIAVVYAVNKRSPARQARMLQWSQVNNGFTSASERHHSMASPLRGGPPPRNDVPSPGLNAYSSSLPPSGGRDDPPPPTGALRRNTSRSGMVGNVSPWHSLRAPSSAGGYDDDRDRAPPQHDRRMSPMSSLPSPARPRGQSTSRSDGSDSPASQHGPTAHHGGTNRAMSTETPDAEAIEVFNSEDEEILKALCAEVRSLLIRHVRETVLEMNQLSMNEGVYSLMDMYTGVVSSRTGFAAAAAAAVSHTHGTTSGQGGAPSLGRASTLTRNSKRAFKAGAKDSAVATGSVPWPVGSHSRFNELLSLDFNVWTYTPDELLVLSYEMFTEMRLVDEFQIIPEILKGFFLTVRSNYHDNPFHNWYHGFSVLHFSYLSLRLLTNSSEYLTQHDVLALMIASLCHDIDHPGNTNSFEINTGSELALIHNDLSVLESHHAYTTFRILRQKSSNILCNLRKDTFQSLKKMIVGAIMATDMISHFSECRNLDNLDFENGPPFNIKVPADRQVVVNLLIHSADLSAQCFPTSVASTWEERITREFENQAAKEKSLGIPVAEFMQNLTNPLLRRQNQVNFIDVVLIPWWRATTRIFPGFKPCYKNLLINRAYYDSHSNANESIAPSPQSLSSTVNSPMPTPMQPPGRSGTAAGSSGAGSGSLLPPHHQSISMHRAEAKSPDQSGDQQTEPNSAIEHEFEQDANHSGEDDEQHSHEQ